MTAEEALKIVNALLHSTFGQRLNDVKSVVFLETWKGQTYEVIAEKLGYQNDYVKQVGSQLWRSLSQVTGEDVSKKNIQAVLHRYQQSQSTTQDWGEAIDVSRFYGRQAELQTLATWIENEHCRFVGIFGLGGIGKTTLSVKLAGQIQSQFEYVIWRSLRQALPLNTLLGEILPILMGSEATINNSISILMQQLQQKRCLLVFDNVESVLQSGNRGGQYQQGFEGYQQLFERICDELHQSCLIVTGREKPGGIAVRSGKKLPVRSLSLSGLSVIDGQQILIAKGLDTTPQHQTIVASCSQDLTIRLWEVAPEKLNPEVQTLVGHEGRVWAIAFHPDGKILASCSEDYTIRLWDVATGNCLCVWQGHERWLRSIAFSPDGKLLASGSYDNTIKLWDLKSQKCLQTLRGHRQTVTAIAFSPNSQQLASSSFDRTVKLWDVRGNCLKTFLGHSSRLWTVAYHPNEQQLVSGGDDHATKLWNLQIGRCTKTLKGHTNSVLSLALSPDGNYLASGHEDQTIKLWDIKNGTLVQTLREHTNRVWSVAFQPASQHPLLASGSADYSIKLWDWKLGTCLQTLHGHTSWVWTVVFSPDGRQLASSSYDQTVKLWDISTGQCLKTFKGHNSPVVSVAFSPDGQLLASSEFDGMKLEEIQGLTEAQLATLQALGADS
jgi:WD40 repeat protein